MTDRLTPGWQTRVTPEPPGEGASLMHEPATRYRGYRQRGDIVVAREDEGGQLRALPLHLTVRNHAAEFNWGYGGSGPAQLALAILADAVGAERAEALYQDFKARVIANIDSNEWTFTRTDVLQWVETCEEERRGDA